MLGYGFNFGDYIVNREIKFEYVCKHTYLGDSRIFRSIFDLSSIEDSIDIVEVICNEIDPCTCCFTESQNHCDCDSILDHGEFEIIARRQYTGLKDKNGVEIYEGDIVGCWDTCGFENISQSLSGEVVFMGGCFCVKGNDGYHNRLALTCAENVEVTGNIHQQN